ncbi:MAG TPA: PA14 domain-containing protein [Caldilineaceae bacterium]|nr:PA14 domain-containing protein [Caldilineaceae bacterium]
MNMWRYGITFALLLSLFISAQPATAQSGNQWRIDFFPNLDWAGAPAYTQYANIVDFNWGQGAPGPNLPNQNYSARMSTDAYFYSGVYRFNILADDEVRITINNVTYFDTVARGQAGKGFIVDIPMTQGMSHITVEFRQYGGPGYVHLYWDYVKPDPSAPIYVPSQPAAPPPISSASSLATEYGDYTLCIRQNLHQANCFQSNGQWNSPDLGSVQMEPQIVIWQQCQPETRKKQRLFANRDPQDSKCSKTEAGWFAE